MKKKVADNVKLVGVKNFGGKDKLVDYYFSIPNGTRIYAFSKIYTDHTYNMCKSGIRVNKLITIKKHDKGIMHLVDYTKFILPYFIEEYSLSA